jgi:hypothetical protein
MILRLARGVKRTQDVHEKRMAATKKSFKNDFLMLDVREPLDLSNLGMKWFRTKEEERARVRPLLPHLEQFLDGKIHKTDLGLPRIYSGEDIRM